MNGIDVPKFHEISDITPHAVDCINRHSYDEITNILTAKMIKFNVPNFSNVSIERIPLLEIG